MIGKTLKTFRVAEGQTLADLSRLSGLSIQYISAIETEKRRLTDSAHEKLIRAYHEAGADPRLVAALERILNKNRI